MGKTKPMAKCSGDGNPFRNEPMGVCMCACVCMSYVCMCACWGIFVTLMAFISGQWNAAKTFFLLSCCSYTDTPMNAHSTYIPCKKNPVIPAMCPSNGVFQCANSVSSFFFLRSRKRLRCTLGSVRGCRAASSPLCLLPQRPPRSHEREEHVAAGELGVECRVHPRVRASRRSS